MSKFILSVEPIRYPLTGIGRYTFELGRNLQRIIDENDLLFCNGRHVVNNFSFDEYKFLIPSTRRLRILREYAKKSYLLSSIYFKVEKKLESRALKNYKSCIFHATNFSCPSFDGKKIVTFHDMSPYITPDCQETLRLEFLRHECENTINSADALITVSQASKKSIVDYFGYPSDKIFVTPLACNSNFFSFDENNAKIQLKKIGLRFKEYSLFVGTIEPRKNILTLIKAYRKLPSSIKSRIPLVICGYKGWKSYDIFDEIYQASTEGWLYYLNYVDQITLLSLYSGAKLFCFPSLYEGFGLPVLEAMASKVPVISSDNSSLPEVLGDSGILVDALDVESWMDKILSVLATPSLAHEMSIKGFCRAKQFTWERCALETLNVYKTVEKGE